MEAIYTDKLCMVSLFKGTKERCIEHLRQVDNERGLQNWAIYKPYHNGNKFHSSADENFLVAHNDTYFKNRRKNGELHIPAPIDIHLLW